MSHSTRHDRRRFLQGLTALLATGTAGALFPQLELMGRALAAAPAPGEYRALVDEVKRENGDFIKIMISGLMDFDHYGVITSEPLTRPQAMPTTSDTATNAIST